jgi:large subunit ribosomal protein L39
MTVHLQNSLWKLRTSSNALYKSVYRRCFSTQEVIEHRNRLFNSEQKRQRENVGRIEKIEVRYLGLPSNETLFMNKNLSTPFNCAQHFSEAVCENAVLALINGKKLWDINRPLEESCTLQLLHFKSQDPNLVNQAFWRTCSFLLGGVLQRILKENTGLHLHSFPWPSIKSGSFVHDISLNVDNWNPSAQDLKSIAIEMMKFATENHDIERLEVSHEIALEMFKDNPFKREQLPNISNQNKGVITLYRAGDHIDISKGPMISSTKYISKVQIPSIHKITKEDSNLYRVQGIALPTGFTLSAYAFDILGKRAKRLNTMNLPVESADPIHSDEAPSMQQRI